ncbi:thioredoxin-like protein [Microdochium bolleyi]|uniref:Thioredoxin-like protein n=1 Tax=Microdochium bolleyi TaxID=196109 RepID=A0A136IIL8_9PEZI|nr:thioredoxin-like protein [Microdochium bolleyi]
MSSLRDLLHPTDESPFSSPGSVNTPIPGKSASSTPITYLTIEYILDTICPHCYIGLRNLESAITTYRNRHPDVEFEVVCTPFILDPALYKPGKLVLGVTSAPMISTFHALSLGDINFRNLVASSPYTMPSPVMLPQARGQNLQLSLALALCRGYFEHDLNIYDRSALVDVAVRVLGLSEVEIRSCLQSEEWGRLVEVLSIEGSARIELPGTTASAPAMIFQNQYLHAGWTQTDALLGIFDDLRKGRSPRRAAPAATR